MTFAATLGGFNGGPITIPDWDGLTILLQAVLSTETDPAQDRLNAQGPLDNNNGERRTDDAADLWKGRARLSAWRPPFSVTRPPATGILQ